MSPQKELFAHEHPHQQEPSAEKLFQKAQKNDRIDLSKFSKDQQQALYDWYTKNADTLSHDDRMQFLEQCIANKVIDDRQLLTHIEPLTKTLAEPKDDDAYNDAKLSLRTLGEYLAFMKNPAYLHSLWACWYEIPHQTREDLIQHCTREKPELALLVAPFTDLSKLRVIYSKKIGERLTIRPSSTLYRSGAFRIIDRMSTIKKEQYEEETNFTDHYFENFEDAQPLIESMLAYYEKHQKDTPLRREDQPLQKILSYLQDYPLSEPQEILNIRDTLRQLNRSFLFPYLKKIDELGIEIVKKERWEKRKGEQEKTAMQAFLEKENIPYYDPRKFLTKKEQEEVERLRKIFIKHNPKMAKRLKNDLSGILAVEENLSPERDRRALMRIIDANALRATHTILDSFQNYKHHLSEKEQQEFLLECLARGYPIFCVVGKLGLPKEAIGDLFKKATKQEYGFPLNDLYTNADLQTLLDFNVAHPGEPDLERMIVESIIKDLPSSGYNVGLTRLMKYDIDTVFARLSEKNQQKIINDIDTHVPNFWVQAIPRALECSSLPFHVLLNSWNTGILQHYQEIMYHIKQLEKKGIDTGVTIHDIHQCARAYVTQNSWAFFSYPQIVKENFTDTEKKEYIESRLAPPIRAKFFINLLESSLKDAYRERCKKIIEKDRTLLDACMQWYDGRDIIRQLLESKKIVRYALEQIESDAKLTEAILLDSGDDILKEFFNSSASVNTCLKRIEETEQYGLAVVLLGRIQSIISEIEYAKKRKLKISSPISLSRLKELQRIFTTTVQTACGRQPFLAFDSRARRIPDFDTKTYISQHADEYFAQHPEDLLERTYGGTLKYIYKEILGSGTFSFLCIHHAKILAFSNRLDCNNFSVLPQDLQERLLAINPSLNVLFEDRLDGDIYNAFSSQLKHCAYFPLYEKRLNEIAKKEQEMYGTQSIPKDASIPAEYLELMRSIMILEHNACAREHAEFFSNLPEKQRVRILRLFEFLSVNNLDGDIPFDPKKEHLDLLVSRINTRIHTLFEQVFDISLDPSTQTRLDQFSIEGLGALIIYYQKTCTGHPAMKRTLQETISHIIHGNYESWRLPSTEKLGELQEQRLLPRHLTSQQYEVWKKENTQNFEDVIQYNVASIHSGIRKILEQSIIDGHIDEVLLEQPIHELQRQHAILTEPLEAMTRRQKELQSSLSAHKTGISPHEQEEYATLKQDIAQYMASNKTNLARIKALQYLHALKTISARDIEEQMLTTGEKKRVPFSEVSKTMSIAFHEEFPYFMADAARIQTTLSDGRQHIFSGNRISKTKLFITDRIDIETYMRIGEKPVASCQHYNSGSHNRGLLSYLIDPNTKIIQVYDANEYIIARAILRLMETREGTPALFAERVYSVNNHPKIDEAIITYVQKKAEDMGIPHPPTGTLLQPGSRAPFVYTDAGGGLVPRGIFEVESASTVLFTFKGSEEIDSQ